MTGRRLLVFTETALHQRIAGAIVERLSDATQARVTVLSPAPPPVAGAPDALAACDHASAPWTTGPLALHRDAAAALFDALPAGADLLLFQDQSAPAQALATASRARGGRIWLVQDGFLSFDMARLGPGRRALWPLARRLEERAAASAEADPGARDAAENGAENLRARAFARRHVYLNHFFGCTRPDHAFVHGPAIAQRLEDQFGLPADRITVCGPVEAPPPPASAPRPPRERGRLRGLFFDQCMLRYARITPGGWRREYLGLVRALARHAAEPGVSLTIKLHPAQTDAAEAQLRAAAPDAWFLSGASPVSAAIERADVVVTVTSTAFLAALGAGLPVVFVRLRAAFDWMPAFASPLARTAGSTTELAGILRTLRDQGVFAGRRRGVALADHIATPAQPSAALVADFLQRLS